MRTKILTINLLFVVWWCFIQVSHFFFFVGCSFIETINWNGSSGAITICCVSAAENTSTYHVSRFVKLTVDASKSGLGTMLMQCSAAQQLLVQCQHSWKGTSSAEEPLPSAVCQVSQQAIYLKAWSDPSLIHQYLRLHTNATGRRAFSHQCLWATSPF